MPETITWIDADGISTTLTGQADVDVLLDVNGRFMPPRSIIEERVPLQPGARLRDVRTEPRDVSLLLRFYGATATALRSTVRSYLLKLDPGRGQGKLRVTSHDGADRELNCFCIDGLQGAENSATTGNGLFQTVIPVFHAPDPYWYDTSATSDTYTTGTPATFFPIFPLRLSSSTVFADETVNNTGDVEAWPIWTITGPGDDPILRNLTTGKSITLDYTLAAGETITIDTRPGFKTVTKNDGTNLYPFMTAASSLWSLSRGNNSVRVEMSSSTVASSVVLAYTKRYLGA